MNLGGGLQFLINSLFNVYLYIVIARFVLQIARGDFYNPASQVIAKLTNPLLKPLRRIIPGFGGLDVASIVLFFGLVAIKITVLVMLFGGGTINPGQFLLFEIFFSAQLILNFFIGVIFISVILSWIAPPGSNPFADILNQMAEPVLAPARRLLPPMGGLDFSPMIVLFLLYFIKITFGL